MVSEGTVYRPQQHKIEDCVCITICKSHSECTCIYDRPLMSLYTIDNGFVFRAFSVFSTSYSILGFHFVLNVTLLHWVIVFGQFERIYYLHLPKSRTGLTILWHACQKCQAERFPWHAAFIAVPFFCLVLPYICIL
jgi:hypothetical protein